MNIDIENIKKIENTHKHNETPWRIIFNFIQQEFFEENDISPEEFVEQCKYNANENHNMPTDVKKT